MILHFLHNSLENLFASIILPIYPDKFIGTLVQTVVWPSGICSRLKACSSIHAPLASSSSLCLAPVLLHLKGFRRHLRIGQYFFPSKYFEGFLYLHFTLLSLCLFRCTFNISHVDSRPAKGNVTSLDTFGPQRPVRYAVHSSCFASYFDGSMQQKIIPVEPLIFLSLAEA